MVPLAAAHGRAPRSRTARLPAVGARGHAEAFGHRGYVLLTLGFFVCGFQVVFVGVHLPAYLADRGMRAARRGDSART